MFFKKYSHSYTFDGINSFLSYMAVKYEKMIPLLVEAIKEQQSQIEGLRKEIGELKDGST